MASIGLPNDFEAARRSKRWIIGGAMAAVLLLAVCAATNYTSFLSLEGLVIVVGGSIANALLSYPHEDVRKAFFAIREMIKKPHGNNDGLHKDIMQFIMWSYVVQAKDFIGLEKESAKASRDPFTRYGLDLVVSGYQADKIREMMHTVAEAEFERRTVPVTVLRNMAANAPSFGMVGTLVGMVILLHNAGTDIANIEGGLGIAMLSTLYGILLARLVCLPAADKMLQQEEKTHFRHYMLTEGLAMLAEKQKPFYMQDRLNSYLEPEKQLQLNSYMQVAFNNRIAMAA